MGRDETDFWPEGPSDRRSVMTMDGGICVDDVLVQKPDRYAYFRQREQWRPTIPRGAGLSFAAASFSAESIAIELTAFDRILGFDSNSAVVEVEAGITLGALFKFLAPRGYYLLVQPGHYAITVGGCIAADVHGKNPARDGTFITQVEQIRLFHPRHGYVEISREKESPLFHATCGGMGLTGIIVSARLRANPLPGATMQLSHRQVATAAEGALMLRSESARCDLTYAWFDFSRRGHAFSHGVAVIGNLTPDSQKPGAFNLPSSRFSAKSRARLSRSLLNPISVRLMNAVYALMMRHPRVRIAPIAKAFYPTRFNELYLSLFGRTGFHEFQAIIPYEKISEYVEFIRSQAASIGTCVTLAVAKPFAGKSDLIRFNGMGISLAIETPRTVQGARLLEALDGLIVRIGGRPNLIKDARLPRTVFEATYPEYDRFKTILREWDPRRMFRSELSDRLGL